MVDPYLAAIVRAAEDGADCPALWMSLMSGDLVTGVPRPSREFVDGTHAALIRQFNELRSGEMFRIRPSKEAKGPTAEIRSQEAIKSFNVDVDPSDALAITLSNATVLWGGHGAGVGMGVVRLNLNAIALWWVAGGRAFKGDTGAFFGVAVPIG